MPSEYSLTKAANNHLPTTTTIFGIPVWIGTLLMTSKQRHFVNNDHYFGVLKVDVVQRVHIFLNPSLNGPNYSLEKKSEKPLTIGITEVKRDFFNVSKIADK